jgi:maleylacetoacetate isomerase/maleylpyruvate isomerase
MKLFSYWRSIAAFRVRIALNLKGLKFELESLDLMKGEQLSADYHRVNPQMTVPTLVDGDATLIQSLAILEYLDERYPTPSLLPKDLRARAYVRAIANIFAADSHPFVTPRVRTYLERELQLTEAARMKWMMHWMTEGLRAVETLMTREDRARSFCDGNAPSLADLCLVAHITGCKMSPQFDFGPFPVARRIFDHCMTLEAFRLAAPDRQPGALESR